MRRPTSSCQTLARIAALLLLAGCAGSRPANLGVKAGRLARCPRCSNCVSSQVAADSDCHVAPLTLKTPADTLPEPLLRAISATPRTTIVTRRARYLHAEARSRIFGFVDDLELVLDDDRRTVHLRSASRVGYSDFGVNRERVEALRQTLARQGLLAR